MAAELPADLVDAIEAATDFVGGETSSPELLKRVDRVVTAVLERARAAGRIPRFKVRSEFADGAAAGSTVLVEIVLAPPTPRVRELVVRLSLG